jgi:hypothetical protein
MQCPNEKRQKERKKEKQRSTYITLPRKIKIEPHEPNKKSAVQPNKKSAVPTPVGKFLSQIESNRRDVIYILFKQPLINPL